MIRLSLLYVWYSELGPWWVGCSVYHHGRPFLLNIGGTTSAPCAGLKAVLEVDSGGGRPSRNWSPGITPGKIWEICVQNRAFSCKQVPYFSYNNQTIDFVLNAKNFVLGIFDQPVDGTRRFYAARTGHIHTVVNIWDHETVYL